MHGLNSNNILRFNFSTHAKYTCRPAPFVLRICIMMMYFEDINQMLFGYAKIKIKMLFDYMTCVSYDPFHVYYVFMFFSVHNIRPLSGKKFSGILD